MNVLNRVAAHLNGRAGANGPAIRPEDGPPSVPIGYGEPPAPPAKPKRKAPAKKRKRSAPKGDRDAGTGRFAAAGNTAAAGHVNPTARDPRRVAEGPDRGRLDRGRRGGRLAAPGRRSEWERARPSCS